MLWLQENTLPECSLSEEIWIQQPSLAIQLYIIHEIEARLRAKVELKLKLEVDPWILNLLDNLGTIQYYWMTTFNDFMMQVDSLNNLNLIDTIQINLISWKINQHSGKGAQHLQLSFVLTMNLNDDSRWVVLNLVPHQKDKFGLFTSLP